MSKKKIDKRPLPPALINAETLSNDMQLIGGRLANIELLLHQMVRNGNAILGFVSQMFEHSREMKNRPPAQFEVDTSPLLAAIRQGFDKKQKRNGKQRSRRS